MTPDAPKTLRQFLSGGYAAGGLPVTRVIFQPLAACVAYAAMRTGLTPNNLTFARLLFGLTGSCCFAVSGMNWGIAATLFWLVGYLCDCADGQLARATGASSKLGAWFDVYADFLVIISTGFACAFFLLSQVDTIFVFVAASVFTAGSACALYTSTIKRQAQPAPNKPSKKRLVGVVARILIDSPVSIIFLCSLRIFPQALAMYLLVAGTVYIVLSLIIGYKNFQE